MIWNVQHVLILISLVLALVSGITGKVPLWIPVMLICIALLVP
jgi:hypothetical protein